MLSLNHIESELLENVTLIKDFNCDAQTCPL